jgi:2-polyprenyl-3-methyl-5-hydroxy-6-metoxy-1,4-benzoquinol methylase
LPPSSEADWAVALFDRSVLKQAKFRRIASLLDEPSGKTNLDIGADNGVISYLLRRRGGEWHSADLDERAVASIRQLVGKNVYRLEGARTPFPDRTFDQVIVVDYLEHISDDHAFGRELERIVRPGGRVIINVPHLRPGSLLNRFRHALGLTDDNLLARVLGADRYLPERAVSQDAKANRAGVAQRVSDYRGRPSQV